MRCALTLLGLLTLLVACSSDDAEKCPIGERTTKVEENFADLGYPDDAVACRLREKGLGPEATAVFYKGIDNVGVAAAKLISFMHKKGYSVTAPKHSGGGTQLIFQRDGDSVRYSTWLAAVSYDEAVALLDFSRVDCAKTPKDEICK